MLSALREASGTRSSHAPGWTGDAATVAVDEIDQPEEGRKERQEFSPGS
jgi:hypothetical protein